MTVNYQDKKIMIVDDDQNIIDLYSMKLKNIGYQVSSAIDAKSAEEQLSTGLIPDVILLDIIMPNLNGIEFLNKIRNNEKYKNTLVFLLSNLDRRSDMDDDFKTKVNGYFVKADTIPSVLANAISEALEKRS
jgi:CheY-like chemotaxis protein